jgi:gas vesicle protein
MKIHETLSDALGIEHEVLPPVVVHQVQEVIAPTEGQVDQEEDYRLARKTFRQLINKGNDAIEGISDLAKESESPRAYEVMATLMKTVADTTKDLFELQKKNKDLQKDDKKRPQDEERLNIERAVFVGSTADLLKQIKLEKKE